MSKALSELVNLLQLKQIEPYVFEGESQDLGLPQVFGGQLVAQALSAAMQAVNFQRELHSCHCYFLRAGKTDLPIFYHCEIWREGSSFTVVSVEARQQGEALCRVMASFQKLENGVEFQVAMPDVPMPTAFYAENDLIKAFSAHLPPAFRAKFEADRAFDVYVKYANNPFQGKILPPSQQVWAKTNGSVMGTPSLHQCLLAYFSDFHCMPTALHPHKQGFLQAGLQIASLDHCIWFHRSVNVEDWLLFDIETTNANNARALTCGRVFNQQGQLLASYQQEGIIRLHLS